MENCPTNKSKQTLGGDGGIFEIFVEKLKLCKIQKEVRFELDRHDTVLLDLLDLQ